MNWLRKRTVLVLTVVLILASLPAIVYAHTVYTERYVWESGGGKCVFARSSIWEQSGDIYAKILSNPRKEWGWTDCAVGWSRLAGDIEVENWIYKVTPSYVLCTSSGTFSNNQETTEYEVTTSSNGCGSGTYDNGGYTRVDTTGAGGWEGGWTFSGEHQF
jgi:hypothetical protein